MHLPDMHLQRFLPPVQSPRHLSITSDDPMLVSMSTDAAAYWRAMQFQSRVKFLKPCNGWGSCISYYRTCKVSSFLFVEDQLFHVLIRIIYFEAMIMTVLSRRAERDHAVVRDSSIWKSQQLHIACMFFVNTTPRACLQPCRRLVQQRHGVGRAAHQDARSHRLPGPQASLAECRGGPKPVSFPALEPGPSRAVPQGWRWRTAADR